MRHSPFGRMLLHFLPLLVAGCGGRHASPATTVDATPPVDVEARVTSENDWTSPSVRHVAWTVTGRLTTDQVARIVRQNTGRFRLCYDEALRRRPEMEGGIDVVFRIDPKGTVTQPREVGSTVGDSRVIECVLRGFTPIAFPPAEDGDVEVRWSLAFEPGRRLVRTPSSE